MVVPTPPLAPATAIRLPASAPTAVSSPETRSRRARDHCAAARRAGLELLERERQRDDVADAGLHRGAHQVRVRVGREQHHPDLREGGRDLARDVHHRDGAEHVVQRDDFDVEPAQGARELFGLRDALDDLELVALGGERRGGSREVGVADRDEEPLAHWPPCCCCGPGRRYTRSFFSSSDSSPGRSSASRTSAANDSA